MPTMPEWDEQAMQAWREGLVTGDEVAVCFTTPRSSITKVCVVRVTATLICTEGVRFRRSDGVEAGRDPYQRNTCTLLRLTPALHAEIARARQHRQAIGRCQRTRWEDQPLAVLTAVIAALDASGR